jgi:hypothetical protein
MLLARSAAAASDRRLPHAAALARTPSQSATTLPDLRASPGWRDWRWSALAGALAPAADGRWQRARKTAVHDASASFENGGHHARTARARLADLSRRHDAHFLRLIRRARSAPPLVENRLGDTLLALVWLVGRLRRVLRLARRPSQGLPPSAASSMYQEIDAQSSHCSTVFNLTGTLLLLQTCIDEDSAHVTNWTSTGHGNAGIRTWPVPLKWSPRWVCRWCRTSRAQHQSSNTAALRFALYLCCAAARIRVCGRPDSIVAGMHGPLRAIPWRRRIPPVTASKSPSKTARSARRFSGRS